jgi:hypothetical protein
VLTFGQIEKRVDSWKKGRTTQHYLDTQLQWEASVVEYVNFLWDCTRVNRDRGKETGSTYLPRDIPLLGPRFVPPSYPQLERRQYAASGLTPDMAYVKPITIVHPFYYPSLTICPKCQSKDSKDISWKGWTSTGSREVHGVQREETAMGYQLQCRACEISVSTKTAEQKGYCYATTNPVFWQNWEYWQIPRR